MSEKKQETTQELYNRVHSKFYKMYKNIAMQIKIADEVIKKLDLLKKELINFNQNQLKMNKQQR